MDPSEPLPVKKVFSPRKNFYVDTAFRVLHEDADLVVVDKPAPLAVHPVGMYRDLNLQSLMLKDARWAGTPVKTVHRLDAETSGVLIIAKNTAAAGHLGRQFEQGHIRKGYEAIVFGAPALPAGEIVDPLGYDKSSGFQTVRIRDVENGESAHTCYEVISCGGGYARVRLTPLTGRTHQLRAHLAILGHPIVGDKIYVDLNLFERYVRGGMDAEILERLKLPRLALHASWISFVHPTKNEAVRYEAPLAPMLSDFAVERGMTLS
ncbi:MAG: RluA family pseudouridine synthase [Candidatus Omnitrophica bacterium]|nr:RluA family pseudouridine synthase [Candidatus Omnitrophota bacterium]